MKSLIQVVVSLFALVSVPIRGLFNLTTMQEQNAMLMKLLQGFRPHQGII